MPVNLLGNRLITGDIGAVGSIDVPDSSISERQFAHPVDVATSRQWNTTHTRSQRAESIRTEIVAAAHHTRTIWDTVDSVSVYRVNLGSQELHVVRGPSRWLSVGGSYYLITGPD